LNSLIYNTQNILELSKLKLGHSSLNLKTINIGDCLSELCELFEYDANLKKIDFVQNFSSKLFRQNAICDETKIKLLLFNIVSNAIKFTESGFVKVSAKLISMQNLRIKLNSFMKDSSCNTPPNNDHKLISKPEKKIYTPKYKNMRR
jgi:signal transduction histidine kinase